MDIDEESGVTAAGVEEPERKRRGPRKESEIRAEVEEQMREQLRAEALAQVRAEEETRLRVARESAPATPAPTSTEMGSPVSRDELEREIRAQIEEEQRAALRANSIAGDDRPITGADLDGDPAKPGSVTVHFVEDGLTLLGKVWYRGEELTINPNTSQWDEAVFQGGPRLILDLDEDEQIAIYKRRYFRPGPWRGKGFDLQDNTLTEGERRQLALAEERRMARYSATL